MVLPTVRASFSRSDILRLVRLLGRGDEEVMRNAESRVDREGADAILDDIASGAIDFVRVSRAEVARRKRRHAAARGVPDDVLAARADAGDLRPLRAWRTLQRLRSRNVNKTSRYVPAAVLAEERAEAVEAGPASQPRARRRRRTRTSSLRCAP